MSSESSMSPAIEQLANTDILAIQGKFKTYAEVKVGNVIGTAILDSGNNWRTAISTSYARQLHIDVTLASLINMSERSLGVLEDVY